ncbi:EamA family transporter [Sphingomonas oleivorans]|uniref:EamA family transporter n=1 Tax=Sphingomonas oleivorans TaxID=1735121 RepID=A0A2T5FWQ4_9SPHN|nr:DMT family transporter [Sphingomonas oleivorans]PTQ10192.1 EamA family transporter [Sphingomonas oleivorans]
MNNGVLLAFLSYSAFALSDASVKLLEGTLDPFQVAFTGALLGLAVLPFIRRPEDRYGDVFATSRRDLWLLRAGAAMVGTVCSVIAFTTLPMPEAFVLIFLMPLFVTILSVLFLKEQVGPWRWTAVVLGFLGVLVVLRPGFRDLHGGHLAAFACGLASAASVVALRHARVSDKPISLFGSGLVGSLVGNGILMLPGLVLPDGRQIIFLLGYGLLAALGQMLLILAAQRAPASQIAPPQYSQMVWAVALSYLLFDQPVDVATFIGIAIIIGAGLLTWARERIRFTRMGTMWRGPFRAGGYSRPPAASPPPSYPES